MDVLGFRMREEPEPIDGESLLPILRAERHERLTPIGFESQQQMCLTDNEYKLYSADLGETYELYDLLNDPFETQDIAADFPETVQSRKKALNNWRESCRESCRRLGSGCTDPVEG